MILLDTNIISEVMKPHPDLPAASSSLTLSPRCEEQTNSSFD